MNRRSVLILGAHSAIAIAAARAFAAEGHALHLAARQPDRLAALADELAARHGIPVTIHAFDILVPDSTEGLLAALPALPDIVICAVGLLGDQARAEVDPDHAALILRTNLEGPAIALNRIAGAFARRGSGWIVGISSVAGERGRASNAVYGASKAGFTAFLSGLRNRLQGSGVGVTTVLPGFVDTPMVAGRDLPRLLTARPEEVASAILRAVLHKRDIVYVGRRWRVIMGITRALPEGLFKRTRF